MNTGADTAIIRVSAFDADGRGLETAKLSDLAPMATARVAREDLFVLATLQVTASLHLTASEPLSAVQLLSLANRRDVGVLTGSSGVGRTLFLPVFAEQEGVALWTLAGLINPGDEPIGVALEAFDSNKQSLGLVTGLSSLPPRGSHVLSTANLGGGLAPSAAFVTISADPCGVFITPVSNNLGAAARWAAFPFRPSDVTDSVEAFGIVDQVVDLDEQSIALAVLNHGLSFRVRDAQHNYAKTMEKSRA
jgi:hypothetical protein